MGYYADWKLSDFSDEPDAVIDYDADFEQSAPDITTENLIAPAFYEAWNDFYSGTYLDIKTGERKKLREQWFSGGRGSTKSSFCAAAITLGLEDDWNKALDHKYGRNGCGIGPHKDRPDPHWYRYITNAIVYRKVGNTLADSVFNQFFQTMGDYMGPTITDHWEFKHSPLRIVNTLTGQVIMFRGLDDPLKSKSIKPPKGYFKYLWFEELAEYKGAEEIRNVRQSIVRGGHEFKVLCSYNPPETASEWVNDAADKDVEGRVVYKSDYTSVPVEWLGEDFFVLADQLKEQNYRAWRHEYMGDVTGNGGTIFENLVKQTITDEEIARFDKLRYGTDFGYALDPACFTASHYDSTRKLLYIFDEIYQKHLLHSKLAELIKGKVRSHDWVMCDSAEPKSIDELHGMGVNTLGAKKGPDSVEFGIKWLQSLRFIVIDPVRCPHTYDEFKKYEYEKDKSGEFISKYPDKNNHSIDSVRYALENDMSHGGLF